MADNNTSFACISQAPTTIYGLQDETDETQTTRTDTSEQQSTQSENTTNTQTDTEHNPENTQIALPSQILAIDNNRGNIDPEENNENYAYDINTNHDCGNYNPSDDDHIFHTIETEARGVAKSTLNPYGKETDCTHSSSPSSSTQLLNNFTYTLEHIISHVIHNGKARFQYKWKNIKIITTDSEKTALENQTQLYEYLARLKNESRRKYNHLLKRFKLEPAIIKYMTNNTTERANNGTNECKCARKLFRLKNGKTIKPKEAKRAKKRLQQDIDNANLSESSKKGLHKIVEEMYEQILGPKNHNNAQTSHKEHDCSETMMAANIVKQISSASDQQIIPGRIQDHTSRRGKLAFITMAGQKISAEEALSLKKAELKEYVTNLSTTSQRKYNHLMRARPEILSLFQEKENTP